jgi:hypothetical protein
MAEKISKTARASMRGKKAPFVKNCKPCNAGMIATKVLSRPRGMYWVCSVDSEHREKC